MLALYFSEVSLDITGSEDDQALLAGIEKLAKHLEIENLIETLLEPNRRIARQRRTEEVERGRGQLDEYFERAVVGHQMRVDRARVDDVKWDCENSIFADVLLCADEDAEDDDDDDAAAADSKENDTLKPDRPIVRTAEGPLQGIPVGPSAAISRDPSRTRPQRKSVLFPVHRAMLLRSEYFAAMFSSPFREAQPSEYLPIVHVDCSPAVLQVVLKYLYTEHANFGLDVAIDVLFAADQLFIEKLKVRAGMIIATLGNGDAAVVDADTSRNETNAEEVLDVYDVVRAGWLTRVHRLEEFGARYIAYRLERYIDEQEFKELVRESAARIQARQETDTVELVDEYVPSDSVHALRCVKGVRRLTDYYSIRYYLSERFRLRFEDSGFDKLEEQEQAQAAHAKQESLEAVNGQIQAMQLAAQANDEAIANEVSAGVVRTLDGELVGDEFAQDAINYQILLGKIDTLLDELKLDA